VFKGLMSEPWVRCMYTVFGQRLRLPTLQKFLHIYPFFFFRGGHFLWHTVKGENMRIIYTPQTTIC